MRNIEREGDTDPSVLEGRGVDGHDVGATARKGSFEDDDRWIFSMPGHDQDHLAIAFFGEWGSAGRDGNIPWGVVRRRLIAGGARCC